MTIRDTQREIRKASRKKDLKDAGASAALGGTAGAALMPVRPIRPRGKRQDEAKALWAQAESAGGKPGGSANVKVSPEKFVRIGQVKGHRLFNDSRVADMAHKTTLPKDDPRHIDEGKLNYTTTAYKDKKGRVTLRQQNGRHGAEALAMRGKDVPTRIHMVEGDTPTEKNAVKAVYRHFASKYEGRKMGGNLNLTPDSIKSKAKKYPEYAHTINEKAHDIAGYKAGSSAETLPWKAGKEMSTKKLRGKQAAYVGGGAAALAGANALSEKVSGKGVGTETIKAGKNTSDFARTQVAAAIDPNKKMITKKVNKKVLKPLAVAVGGGTAGGVIANQLPQNQKDSRKLIKKADDKIERTAAGATGATAGVLAMPMRDKIGKYPKKFAEKYKDIPEGTHQMKMSSADMQTIAAPGFREKKMPWKDKKTNIKYTTRMAADIHRGKMKSKDKPRIAIYDDAARVTGGQHRVHANAWSGMKEQDIEVVRLKGYYGGTERGHKAIRSRLKRATYPKMFIKANPKDTKDLLARDAKIADNDPALLRAKKGATETARVDIHKPFTKGDLRKLKGKQAAYIGGGTAAAIGAREAYRKYA